MPERDRTTAARFLEAMRNDDGDAVASQLAAAPALEAFDVFTAAAAGNAAGVSAWLARDPSLAAAADGHEAWTPLAYACRSPLHRASEARAAGLRNTAAVLLDAGASTSHGSVYWESPAKSVPIPVLYHACMSDHPALVQLLLERGAPTQDGESIYHAAQYNRRACLELLLQHGADLSSRQSPYGNTPLYFLVGHHDDEDGRAAWFQGMTWLLEHGADPNVPSYRSGETPLHGIAGSPPKLATALALLAHGADVNARRADGRTSYQIAVRRGNTAIASLLREHGAETAPLDPADAFFGACLAGDADQARALLARHPDLRSAIAATGPTAMNDAVRQGRPEAVRLMTTLGFPVAGEEHGGGTPLHWAAWLGRVELVRVLLELGAPIDVRDRQYGASPLGWAAHGSACHHGGDDRYGAIVDLLVDAGTANTTNKWEKTLRGSPAVEARLRERGIL